jgi:hypothetical protein
MHKEIIWYSYYKKIKWKSLIFCKKEESMVGVGHDLPVVNCRMWHISHIELIYWNDIDICFTQIQKKFIFSSQKQTKVETIQPRDLSKQLTCHRPKFSLSFCTDFCTYISPFPLFSIIKSYISLHSNQSPCFSNKNKKQ